MKQPNKKRILWLVLLCAAVCCMGAVMLAARFRTLRADPIRAFETPTPKRVVATTPTPTPYRTPIVPYTPKPTPTVPPAQVLGSNTINIVLMGLDSDEEREKANRGYRSDTIAILVVDVAEPACTVLSIPRDTRAQVQSLNSKGKVIGTQYNKINSAFHYGGGPEKSGHENLIAALERLLFDGLSSDVNLHYYASIDMDSIAMLADAVGGVPLTLPYDVQGFGKEGEEIWLHGVEARKFVRLRHGITGGSDIGRVERQQLFIRAFAQQVQRLGAKEAVPLLWSTLSSEIHTNLSTEQILVLADLLTRIDLATSAFITLPGSCKTIEGRSYYVAHTNAVRELALTLWGESQPTGAWWRW